MKRVLQTVCDRLAATLVASLSLRMAEHDSETRSRLLAAATRLFADQGFRTVTVRDICHDAGANVASINYHFGDKLGLYREVLDGAIQTMCATTDAARAAGEGGSPEYRLCAYVRVFLQRVVSAAGDSWIHQLMMRELADPTPALALVSERVIRPRLEFVASIVADMLERPTDDPVVRRCVLSIQSQVHSAMPSTMSKFLLPDLQRDAAVVDRLADHIAQFSVAGIHAVAGPLRDDPRAVEVSTGGRE